MAGGAGRRASRHRSGRSGNALHVDLGAGYWLYRNRTDGLVNSLAAILELHYTATLADADHVTAAVFPNLYDFGGGPDHRNIWDLVVGVHAELGPNTLCRVGGVFPLSTGGDRTFDAEVQAQVERRF